MPRFVRCAAVREKEKKKKESKKKKGRAKLWRKDRK